MNIVKFSHCGLFETESEWIHPERTEPTYEIICVIDGEVHIAEENCEYSLQKDDLIILKPCVRHAGFKSSNGKTSFYWIHFVASDFSALDIEQRFVRKFNSSQLCRKLLHAAHTAGYPPYGIDGLLMSLLAEISSTAHIDKNADKMIYNAAEWIRINSVKSLSVTSVAARYGYNEEHFSRLFRKVYSIGLKEYITSERLKAAQNLLCNTDFTVRRISYELNFGNSNQFIQFFKYHQGESPSKFRKKYYNILMNNS